MKLKTLDNLELEGKTVILRCDLNVPLDNNGKVTDITKDNDNPTTETMGAMSLKKLQKKLDHKKLYKVEYINKKGNQLIAHISGIEPK